MNACGSTFVSATSATPNPAPTTTDQRITRVAAARARAASPAPSRRPTSTCAAIASASSTSARNTNSWNAIWCAASDAAPTRASTAEATRNEPSSAVVRTAISLPIRISGFIFSSSGGSKPARRWTCTNASPIPTCAITVPQAEPARPQSKPYTNSSSSTTLTPWAINRITSGVRRSPMPRRNPWPAVASMKNGAPSAAIRRYSVAPSATSPSPPISATAPGASATIPASSSTPIPIPSHSACDPSAAASASRPGAVQPRHLRRGPVGEEVEDRERRAQHRGGDRERGELGRPEVPDDRRVDEHVERLGRERPERGERQGKDFAVERRDAI